MLVVAVYFFAPSLGNNNSTAPVYSSSGWSIGQVTSAQISTSIYASLGLDTYTFTPTSSTDSFLTVTFDLAPKSDATMLDLENIVLSVDGQPYIPSGMDSRVGSLSGNVTVEEVEAEIVFVESGTDLYTIYWPVHEGIRNINLIYVVPTAYLNGTHNLQLQIAGTNEA